MIYILYLIFYGFLLTAVLGLLASWVDRKVTARIQFRVGPPFYQPFVDIMKLLGKETLIPRGSSKLSFLTAPMVGFSSIVLLSTILWFNNFNPGKGFIGDLIVILYLLIIPSLSLIMGGFASGNLYASIGSSREMKLILSYELPFILAIIVPIMHSGYSLKLGEIIMHQVQNGAIIGSWSGFLAFSVAVLVMQAKLALVPFDIPEAETEIASGLLIEYSGPALAIFRLTKNMLLFAIPLFLIILFMGGLRFNGIHILFSIGKYVGLLILIIVIRNTNPRVKIDQAMRFFWGPVTAVAIIAIILALVGW